MDMKKILQALDGASTMPVEGSNDMKKFMSIINEGANPHKVTLPVQMAMHHYSEPAIKEQSKPSLFKQYFAEAEESIHQEKVEKRQLMNQYAKIIAERVQMKESKDLTELSKETLSKYIKANAEDRVQRASGRSYKSGKAGDSYNTSDDSHQDEMRKKGMDRAIKQLAKENFNPNVSPNPGFAPGPGGPGLMPTESTENKPDVVKLDIPLIIRLFEYAREDAKTDMDIHNVTEMLIQLSEHGDTLTMDNYDQIVGEQKMLPSPTNESCWKDYKQIGMKKKGNKTVPNCVPKGK